MTAHAPASPVLDEHPPSRRPLLASDLPGALLLALALLWTQLAAQLHGVSGAMPLLLLAAPAAGFVAGRLLAARGPLLVPLAIVAVGLILLADAGPAAIYSRVPRGGPFGYSSITGAFYAQCAVAAVAAAALLRRWPARVALGLLAAAFAWVAVATGTRAAVAALFGVVPAVLLVRAAFGARRAVQACQAVFVAGLLVTVGLAATHDRRDAGGPVARLVDATLSERRVALHRDALVMMRERPLLGVGAGRYGQHSAAVAADRETPWAHHEFLQQGAEAGVMAFALLVLLFLWAFQLLQRRIASRSLSVAAALALATLGLHACVEYVLQRPAVPVLAAALVGAATAGRPRRGHERLRDPSTDRASDP